MFLKHNNRSVKAYVCAILKQDQGPQSYLSGCGLK